MTRRELKTLLNDCGDSPAGLKKLAETLRGEVLRGVYRDDPLGLFILEARAGFRRTQASDKTKHGKRIELAADSTYVRAQALGFRGPWKAWICLLRDGKTASEVETPTDDYF